MIMEPAGAAATHDETVATPPGDRMLDASSRILGERVTCSPFVLGWDVRDRPSRSSVASTDAILAARLATEAGVLLLALRRDHDPVTGTDALRDAGDRAAHRLLAGALAAERPGDAVLSE